MKNFILFILLSTYLFSGEVILEFPDGEIEKYLKKDSNTYYKDAVEESSMLVRTNNTLIVSFKNDMDMSNFEDKHGVKFLNWINKYSKQALFKLDAKQDIFEVCNDINKENFIKFSQPNFIRARGLR